MNSPESQKQIQSNILTYLETYFYDGPYDKAILMQAVMRENRGHVNPAIAEKTVDYFLENPHRFLE